MTGTDRDTDARNRIVSDIDTNFFVEAGAGSGKTTMLVNRMVAMVEAGIPISKICAITFTKAAAGEFYDRFQRLLIERSSPDYVWTTNGHARQLPAPTDVTRKYCAEALKNIDLCFMGTIDSFCGMVLAEHPSEAGIPSDASIVSDDDASVFYKQQYVKICSGAYGGRLEALASSFRSFYRNAEDVFVQGEAVMMNNRNVHFNYTKMGPVDIDSDFDRERNAVIQAVKCLVDHPELKYDAEKNNLAAWDKIDDIYKNVRRRWSSNFSGVVNALKSFKDIRLIPDALNRCGASLAGMFELGGVRAKWLESVVGRKGGLYDRLVSLQYSASMEFLEACVPVLEDAMRDKGSLTFFDYLYYLRNMLRRDAEDDGKLIRYIYDRHSYFLIDEFQDTNPMQAEVFFYLASEHPVPRWSACVPRPGSLFIVGDPKQSIYRFRSADVTSFLKVKGLFENNGGAILSLSRNFRSVRPLCEHFNRAFTAMLPEETADQSKFEEIPLPNPRSDEFQGAYKYTAYTASLEAEHPDEIDPKQISKIIQALVDNDGYKIRTKGDAAPRKLRYSDIMVITYGKKKLGPIMACLDAKGIPTRVEGDVPFGLNEALKEVYRIYSAVADADDAVSLYGALTGRLVGLAKEDILKYKEAGGMVSLKASFDVEACTDVTARTVGEKIVELKRLRLMATRLSPAALFAKIMDAYRVYCTVEAENLEVVYYTLELLRNAEKSGTVVSLEDGVRYIGNLIDGLSGEERCLSLNEGKDAVHMANLHKVKGLEAPVVILSASVMFNNSVDKRIVHGDDGSEGYIFGLPRKDDAGNARGSYFETNEFTDEVAAEKASSNAENQRLVYVAATRARNVLIICDSISVTFGNEVHRSVWKPVMDGLPDVFEAVKAQAGKKATKTVTVDSTGLYEEAERTCVLKDRGREEATYTIELPSRLRLSSKIADDRGAGDEQENVADRSGVEMPVDGVSVKPEKHRFPALLGTMVHKLMEMLVSSHGKVDVTGMVDEIVGEYLTPSLKIYENSLSTSLTQVVERMKTGGYTQSNGLPQDILNTLLMADEVYCEVPFCYADNNGDDKVLWNGVMDVIYRVGNRWHIVDYKTNVDGSNLDTVYRSQLDSYTKAFREMTGEEADAATYHIDI